MVGYRISSAILGLLLVGCLDRKPAPVPAAPSRTPDNVASAQQVAGAITDKARAAQERGIVARSTDAGTLVRLAVENETYVGSPAVRVDPDNAQAVDALIGAMQRQEEAYRADRAAWEQRIDAMSRDRDRAVAEVSVLGGAVARLKAWLFWGAVVLAVLCFLCPGLLWFIARFLAGRARAHLAAVVKGVEDFRAENADAAKQLESHLSRKMNDPTKALVLDIKDDIFRQKRRTA